MSGDLESCGRALGFPASFGPAIDWGSFRGKVIAEELKTLSGTGFRLATGGSHNGFAKGSDPIDD